MLRDLDFGEEEKEKEEERRVPVGNSQNTSALT